MEVINSKLGNKITIFKKVILILMNVLYVFLTGFYVYCLYLLVYKVVNNQVNTQEQMEYITTLIVQNSIYILMIVFGWILSVWVFSLICDFYISVENKITSTEKNSHEIKRYLANIALDSNDSGYSLRYAPYSKQECLDILGYAIDNYEDGYRALDYIQQKSNQVSGGDNYLINVTDCLKKLPKDKIIDALIKYEARLDDK